MRKLTALLLLLWSSLVWAAFPTVTSSIVGEDNDGNNTMNTTMPATVNADDVLLMCICNDGNPDATTPAGWSDVGSRLVHAGGQPTKECFAKDADGTEDSAAVDFALDSNERGSFIVYAISGTFDGTPSSVEAGTDTEGTSTTPDPPSFDPSWGTVDTTWYGLNCFDGSFTNTGYPLPDNNLEQTHTGGSGAGVAMASDELNQASLDPGTFTIDTSTPWIANTIAIRPAAGGIDNSAMMRRRR